VTASKNLQEVGTARAGVKRIVVVFHRRHRRVDRRLQTSAKLAPRAHATGGSHPGAHPASGAVSTEFVGNAHGVDAKKGDTCYMPKNGHSAGRSEDRRRGAGQARRRPRSPFFPARRSWRSPDRAWRTWPLQRACLARQSRRLREHRGSTRPCEPRRGTLREWRAAPRPPARPSQGPTFEDWFARASLEKRLRHRARHSRLAAFGPSVRRSRQGQRGQSPLDGLRSAGVRTQSSTHEHRRSEFSYSSSRSIRR